MLLAHIDTAISVLHLCGPICCCCKYCSVVL